MLTFLKNWTLPVAMVLGIIGYPIFLALEFTVPYLIFFMLLLTFSKVPIQEIRFRAHHFVMLAVQLLGAVGVFYLLRPFDLIIAEVGMVCFICPTATAAAVITNKLDGNMNSVTAYTMLSNLVAAFAIPLLFSLVQDQPTIGFVDSLVTILLKVFPLLFGPFIASVIISKYCHKLHYFLVNKTEFAFYLWAVSLSIAIAKTIQALKDYEFTWALLFGISVMAMFVCFIQFYVGKKIGGRFNEKIACGQALGQKNTILAIWVAYTYLNPLVTIGPGAYIFMQNGFNAWQLAVHRRRKEKLESV